MCRLEEQSTMQLPRGFLVREHNMRGALWLGSIVPSFLPDDDDDDGGGGDGDGDGEPPAQRCAVAQRPL